MKSNKATKLTAILAGLFFLMLMGFYPAESRIREKYEEKFERTVKLAKGGHVSLINISGSIEVKSWNKGEVKIDALKTSRASSLSQAKENAAEVKIVVQKEGDTLRIKTEYPKRRGSRRRRLSVSVHYNLWVPSKASVRIDSTSGSVEMENIGGEVKVDVKSGSVDLKDIGGEVKVDVTSGSVTIKKAAKGVDCDIISGRLELQDIRGDAYLKTVSGKIKVERIKGSIEAETTSGGIEMRKVTGAKTIKGKVLSGSIVYDGDIDPNGRYTLHTHSGSIRMFISSGSGFELEAKTFSGRIDSDFDITISGKLSKKAIKGVVNKGGAYMKLSTFSGSIYLRKR
jgi:DUF4097 and DUF4098 domain-containing protein YvlB